MLKQKNIKSFFKPVVDTTESNQEPPAKKCKPDKDLSVSKSSIQEYCSVDNMQKVLTLCNKLKILDPEMGKSWFLALEPEFHKPRFHRLDEFVKKERETFKVYPRPEDVWSWTKCCKLKDVKVVIIGQDPYHNAGQAHGLSFSVKAGVRPPPSLLNIYKELTTDIPGFQTPSHGDLTKWANQGVLLLNACLTVREHAPNSHANQGWEHITDAAINAVNSACNQVVFLLWGAYAQKKAARVDRKEHHVLNAPHPSPLSASRGFFGCKHFSKCNQLLEESGKSPIDWTL